VYLSARVPLLQQLQVFIFATQMLQKLAEENNNMMGGDRKIVKWKEEGSEVMTWSNQSKKSEEERGGWKITMEIRRS